MQQPITERQTYTASEAAEILGVHHTTVYQAVREGRIPAVRMFRRVLIPRQAIEQLLAATRAERR